MRTFRTVAFKKASDCSPDAHGVRPNYLGVPTVVKFCLNNFFGGLNLAAASFRRLTERSRLTCGARRVEDVEPSFN